MLTGLPNPGLCPHPAWKLPASLPVLSILGDVGRVASQDSQVRAARNPGRKQDPEKARDRKSTSIRLHQVFDYFLHLLSQVGEALNPWLAAGPTRRCRLRGLIPLAFGGGGLGKALQREV